MSEPGAIPTSSTPSTPPDHLDEFISQAKERGSKSIMATRRRRTWKELGRLPFDFSLPYCFSEVMIRIKRNLSYFCVNYAMIMLYFTSLEVLTWHEQHSTILMNVFWIVYMIVFLGWSFLYFYCDEPLVVFNRTFDDWLVLIVFTVVTVVVTAFTHMWLKLLYSLLIGALAVGLHASFRVTDNLFLNEQEAVHEGLLAAV